MKYRRLSIESLEDRTTPASAGDLTTLAKETVGTAMFLQELSKNPMVLASPGLRPTVQSYFTGVFQHAVTTLSTIAEFPGTLPAAEQQVVSQLAQIQENLSETVASLLGFSLVPAAPAAPTPPTPTPGAASPARSTVAVSPASVAAGSTTTVTLTAKDANGTALTTGGATVTFALGSQTGGSGTFGAVTDNHNGTYTATFTGTTVGTNTITATINAAAVTTTAPTVTITAAPSLSQSTVAVSPSSVAAGSPATVTLTAKDANGTALTTGGATVAFALGIGTALGNFGPVTDHGNGTYTATFTGTGAGTNTITATIGGQAVTSTAPTITVTAGRPTSPGRR